MTVEQWQEQVERDTENCNRIAEEIVDLIAQLEQKNAEYKRVRSRRDDAKWHVERKVVEIR